MGVLLQILAKLKSTLLKPLSGKMQLRANRKNRDKNAQTVHKNAAL